MRHLSIFLVLLGLIASGSACYQPSYKNYRSCQVRCFATVDCPNAQACHDGLCRAADVLSCPDLSGGPPEVAGDTMTSDGGPETGPNRGDAGDPDVPGDDALDSSASPAGDVTDGQDDGQDGNDGAAAEAKPVKPVPESSPLRAAYPNNFIVDVTGDGRPDAVAIDFMSVYVLPNTRTRFGPAESWATTNFFGTHGTLFADVDKDGDADLVTIEDTSVRVRRSTGIAFASPFETWRNEASHGAFGTFLSDVTGDGRADLIAVGADGVTVHASTGSAFEAGVSWCDTHFVGALGTFFADLNGDNRADAIALGASDVRVRLSTGLTFADEQIWATGHRYGTFETLFADVNGDRMADLMAIRDDGVFLSLSTGTSFAAEDVWLMGEFRGIIGTFLTDLNGDGRADLLAWATDFMAALRSTTSGPSLGETWNDFPFFGRLIRCGDPNPAFHTTYCFVPTPPASNAESSQQRLEQACDTDFPGNARAATVND